MSRRLSFWMMLGDLANLLGWTRIERAADDHERRIILQGIDWTGHITDDSLRQEYVDQAPPSKNL